MARELIYWKSTVPYTVVVRRDVLDSLGLSLNNVNTFIAIEAETLGDFKLANKQMILDGIIVQTDAPNLDWETPNTFTDEEITELLKNYLKLKSTLPSISSISTLARFLDAAREQEKSTKIIKLIKARYNEVTGEDSEIMSPAEMQGVY